MANKTKEKYLRRSLEHLDEGETPVEVVIGAYESEMLGTDTVKVGIFIATETRLVFYSKKMFGFVLESFPYGNISSFEMGKGLMGYSISFFGSGNKVSMKWLENADGEFDRFVAFVRGKLGKSDSSDSDGVAVEEGILEQIRKMGELRSDGLLTDEEFESKKKELLARL